MPNPIRVRFETYASECWVRLSATRNQKERIKDALHGHAAAHCMGAEPLPVAGTESNGTDVITVCLFGDFFVKFVCDSVNGIVSVVAVGYKERRARLATYAANPTLISLGFARAKDR